MKVDILVLGAGISGLSAAYHLQKSGIRTLVIEKQKTVGGRVQSTYISDVGIESGALFLTNSYNRTLRLIKELGIHSQLVPVRARNGIVVGNRIFTLPPHSFFDILKLLPFSSLIKLTGIMLEVMSHNNELDIDNLLKGYLLDTQSVADFSMRYGDSALLDYVFDPILQGIWYWDSASTTRVALYFLLKQAFTMRLYTLKGGLGVLPDSLAQHLDIGLETQAIQSKYDPASKNWKTVVRDPAGERIIESTTVLCTLPATQINGIFVELSESIRTFFAGIWYTSIISMHLLLNEKTSIPRYYGLYYPAAGAKPIAAIAIQSNTIPGQPLPDRSAISIYCSTELSRDLFGKPDEEIARVIVSKLGSSYPFSRHDVSESVIDSRIIRIVPALPVFTVGYICTLKFFHEALVSDLPPGLFFAGDFMGGPHIEGAIISAEEVQPRIMSFLQSTKGGNRHES